MRRTLLCGPLFALLLIPASRASADTFGSGVNSFEIEFVTIESKKGTGVVFLTDSFGHDRF